MENKTDIRGKLIVLEGTDGSGKSTQFSLLCEKLMAEHKPFSRIVFPQYQEPSSALIRMYLDGEFGDEPRSVNAYAASTFYAVDRYASYRKVWGKAYERGGLVLADRYTTSNAIHQTCKVPDTEQKDFIRWLENFEYVKLGLPKPDLVIYLDMPTEMALSLLRSREKATGTHGDIHETLAEYLRLCRAYGLKAAELCGWWVISCVDKNGELRSIQDIHQNIWETVNTVL